MAPVERARPAVGDGPPPSATAAGDAPPAAESVAERAPQVSRRSAAAVTRTAPTRRLRPGDLICGTCGEGNALTRRFCGRCGESLSEAEEVRAPWWRRLLPHRGPKVVALGTTTGKAGAGERPRGRDTRTALRKVYRRGRVVVVMLIVVAAGVYGSYPPFRSLVNTHVTAWKNKATHTVDVHYTPERPAGTVANVAVTGHPGLDAVDSFTSTAWIAPYSTARYPTLTLRLGHRATLEKMILYSGVTQDYTAHGRPALLVLVFSNRESITISPQDTPKPQTFSLSRAVGVTSVTVMIEGDYPGSAGTDTAISDLELFGLG